MPPKRQTAPRLPDRLCDREGAAAYLHVSTRTIDRLIDTGQLPVVRLPVERARHGNDGRLGTCRRVLIDVRDLDRLIDLSKETLAVRPVADVQKGSR